MKRILCGCCSSKQIEIKRYVDEVSNGLSLFDHPGIENQINGIYVTSNETNLAETLQQLRQHPAQEGQTIHIGCATWHNLDIMCARRSSYGLVVDFNPKNAAFMKKTAELIGSCESREAFVAAMIDHLNALVGFDRDLFFHKDQRGSLIERIKGELSREGSWLQNEENYSYIKREIVSKECLISITEDIRNSEKIASIRGFLDRNGIAVDTLYTSNIEDFMNTSEDRDAFLKSVRHLLHGNSIWIHCPLLRQRAILGREVLADCLLLE